MSLGEFGKCVLGEYHFRLLHTRRAILTVVYVRRKSARRHDQPMKCVEIVFYSLLTRDFRIVIQGGISPRETQ
jgi:hypothetical protein